MPPNEWAAGPELSTDHLRIEVREHVVTVAGPLDLATAPQLRACIERRHADPHQRLQIDLSGITFCDSTGLSTLIWAYNTLGGVDWPVLIHPSKHLTQLLAITGLHHLIASEPGPDSLEPALG
jgi:anti-sigma B factor antagonist